MADRRLNFSAEQPHATLSDLGDAAAATISDIATRGMGGAEEAGGAEDGGPVQPLKDRRCNVTWIHVK